MNYCNEIIHNKLIKNDHLTCLFCDHDLQQPVTKYTPCCPKESIINVDRGNVCKNCGIVHGYQAVTEFIDFYENKHICRIVKKSVYERKYHLENTLNDICDKYKL